MLNFNDESVRDNALRTVTDLMKRAYDLINLGSPESSRFYSRLTHRFLMDHAWEILIPAAKEERPSIFEGLEYDNEMPWPQMTTYNYVMSVLTPPSIPWAMLTFGYAIHEGKLVRSTFFTHQKMVPYQVMPQGIVIDPMAIQKGIQPEYYIGCPVCSKDYIENFIKMKQNPFEEYVAKEGHLMR
ncbi:MAG TPA: hypothetical protein VG982_00455 [Candidatus Paceibacterota bacterium]|nr:hypothetical protein [Candidatus Paceibacterota bacterium]